jgi:voltage-gated potassium channel
VTSLPLWLILTLAPVILTAVTAYQVRAIIRSSHPAVRAVQAAAITVPLFIIVFAASYFLLSQTDLANFSTGRLTRTDALYFTVAVFATVGFGDITATSQFARGIVTLQMILDLIVLGAVIRVFIGAVQVAREQPQGSDAGTSSTPPTSGSKARMPL